MGLTGEPASCVSAMTGLPIAIVIFTPKQRKRTGPGSCRTPICGDVADAAGS